MSFTFQKGTTVLLTDGIQGRELLVSSLSVSQTFLEESRSVRTLHSPKVLEYTFTNSKSPVSLDFTCQITPGDGLLFQWLGFLKVGNVYNIPMVTELVPLDVYILTNSSVYKVSNTYITTLSVQMAKTGALSVQVNATGSLWSEQQYPFSHGYSKQQSSDFIHGSLELVGSQNFGGITLEITRDVSWISNHSVQEAVAGSIYVPNKAILDDLAVSGTIVYYKTDSSMSYVEQGTVDFTYGGLFKVHLDKCKILERWETSEIYKKQKDFKLLPTSTNAYIQF